VKATTQHRPACLQAGQLLKTWLDMKPV